MPLQNPAALSLHYCPDVISYHSLPSYSDSVLCPSDLCDTPWLSDYASPSSCSVLPLPSSSFCSKTVPDMQNGHPCPEPVLLEKPVLFHFLLATEKRVLQAKGRPSNLIFSSPLLNQLSILRDSWQMLRICLLLFKSQASGRASLIILFKIIPTLICRFPSLSFP